jgi:hypothetical protein
LLNKNVQHSENSLVPWALKETGKRVPCRVGGRQNDLHEY